MNYPWSRLPRPDVALLGILAFGLALRLWWVTMPFIEAHTWRQVTNADIARNLAFGTFNLLRPRVNWGGRDGYVGMEFPLLHALVALGYRMFGEHEMLGRLIVIGFSMAASVGIYLLGVRLISRPAGRAAALLLAVSPSSVFFGRALLSDVPMLSLSIWGVLGFVTYWQTGRMSALWGGALATALACLTKIPAVVVFAPILTAGWYARGVRGLERDRALLAGLLLAFLLTAGWYWHADRVYLETGLTQAIWRASGTYPPDVSLATRTMSGVSHWADALVIQREFYRELLDRLWGVHLTPPGFTLAAVGLVLASRLAWRGVLYVWLLAVCAFVLASARGQYFHEFHQLPLLAPAALFFGVAAAPAFDGRWLRAQAGWLAPYAVAVILAGISVEGFRSSGVIRHLYRVDNLQYDALRAGSALARSTPDEALVVTVEYSVRGANSPVLLYHSRRWGWSLDVASLSPHALERLRRRFGASFFATTVWSELERNCPEVTLYLEGRRRVPLENAPHDMRLFDLRN